MVLCCIKHSLLLLVTFTTNENNKKLKLRVTLSVTSRLLDCCRLFRNAGARANESAGNTRQVSV